MSKVIMTKNRTARRIMRIACAAAMTMQLTASAFAAPATNGGAVAASDVAASAGTADSPADDWSTLQSQVALLRVKAEIARLQAEIRTAGAAAGSPASSPAGPVGQPAVAVSNPETRAALPVLGNDVRLVSVDAYNGQFGALLDVDGRSVPVRERDVIDGGWTVARITGTTVELRRGAQTRVVRL
jgi:type IV pilus biogenesis protein PilP